MSPKESAVPIAQETLSYKRKIPSVFPEPTTTFNKAVSIFFNLGHVNLRVSWKIVF
jgi:hypothetical protein